MESTLRRRVAPEAPPAQVGNVPSSTNGAASPTSSEPPVNIKVVEVERVPVTRKRRNTLIFLLGSLCGLFAAGFFAKSNDLIDFPEFGDFTLDNFLDVVPAGLLKDVHDLLQGQQAVTTANDDFSVGLRAYSEGLRAHHPVVMIPGVISTGLESWGTANISRPYFRKRLWGSWTMMRALVLDKENWKRHIMLDKETGLDPPQIKLRSAHGFDATDFFITGYWIWSKIFENLAAIGYDPTNAFTAAYDWRLSYANLEVRDRYFSRLKTYIESAVEHADVKVVLASHSMGSQVLLYFFHWVESEQGGRGGADWVDRHVEAWINISGCMLGAVKDLTAVLSGEMRDTAQLNALAMYGLDKFLSKEERAEIFRAMPGMSSMLPIGGDAVWGDMHGAPDDRPGQAMSFGTLLNFRTGEDWTAIPDRNLTMDASTDYLFDVTPDWYTKLIEKSYSRGVAKTAEQVEANEQDPRKWINPLETRLPNAPNLKIYCFYGVGKATERMYYYRTPDASDITSLNITIDTGFTEGEVDHGVVLGEGDGTVSLLSSGYMCSRGWHMKRYNPAKIPITVVEMLHEPERFSPRGGPNTADHVDILGRESLNELLLQIAAGKGDTIQENYVSSIREYADKVKIYDDYNDDNDETREEKEKGRR